MSVYCADCTYARKICEPAFWKCGKFEEKNYITGIIDYRFCGLINYNGECKDYKELKHEEHSVKEHKDT